MSLLCKSPIPASRPFARPRRKATVARCSCEGGRSIARLAEVTAGRLAFGGLLGTSIAGNLTGASMLQQCAAEGPLVWAFVAAIAAGTVATNPGGICEAAAARELQAGRSSMVVLTLLAAFELALVR